MELFRQNGDHVYQAVPLLEFDWIEHGFGTSMSTVWNQEAGIAGLAQIHSALCVYVQGGSGRLGRGDALLTDVPGVRVGVRTADCVPILLVDTRKRAVAAIHAGWRGTAAAIACEAVREFQRRFQSNPADMVAAIGPGIGPCCYEVGGEVARRFREWFPERIDLERQTRLDLAQANRRQLLSAGVPERQIHTAGLCTCCSGGEFYSWRRERTSSGRMVNAIGIL